MASSSIPAAGGGFMPSPPSTAAFSPTPSQRSTTSNGFTASALPHPRRTALKPNSAKEDTTRRYVDSHLLAVSRKYAKKFQDADELRKAGSVAGYTSMREVCRDLDEVVDVLWLSGTPSIQVPYLLSIALTLSSYLPSFPPSPASTFSLLRKLDHAFASLLIGQDVVTKEALPGFGGGRGGLSRTDMIRVRSIVEATRVNIVEVMANEPEEEEEVEAQWQSEQENGINDESDMDIDMSSNIDNGNNEGENDMDVARVYERSIVLLGEALSSKSGYAVDDAG